MRTIQYLIILLLIIGLGISMVSGAVVSTTSVTCGPGESGTLDLVLDTAPAGISGYQMIVSTDNPAVAQITEASFPAWAALSDAVSDGAGAFDLRAIDLNGGVEAGASQISLATLSLKGIGAGTTSIAIRDLHIDDDSGNAVQAGTKPGQITVTGSSPEPGPQEIQVTLNPGWNLINIPMQPAAGSETAEVFKHVQSAGHSILTYDPSAGWVTIGRDSILTPMTGYWIYTTSPESITIPVSGSPGAQKSLVSGWNLAGISGTSSRSAGSALKSLQTWSYVISYDSRAQQYRDATIHGNADDQSMLEPLEGFWIYLSSPGALQPGA